MKITYLQTYYRYVDSRGLPAPEILYKWYIKKLLPVFMSIDVLHNYTWPLTIMHLKPSRSLAE